MIAEKQQVQPSTVVQVERPGHKEMVNYGLGFFGVILTWTLVGTFLTYYYTDVAGISAGVVGTLMLVARLFDGVTDIGMGTLVDRTKSKHGKARPWLLWMGVPLGLATILLFSVPDIGTSGKIVYAYVTYILVILVYTAISIPFKTLLGLMTQEPQGRSILNIYTGIFTMLATLSIMILAQPVASAIGGKTGWTVVAAFSGVTIMVTSYLAFRSTKERVGQGSAALNKEIVPLKIGLKALFTNKYWLIMTLYCVITYTLNALVTGAGLYYTTYILGNAAYFSIASLLLFLPSMIGFFFAAKLTDKFGKRNIALIVSIIGIFGPIIKLIDLTSLPIFLTGTVVQGFGLVPTIMFLYAMINDTAEYGEWKFGFRTQGLVNSAASFGMKVGAGLGGALIGWLLAFGGYVGAAEEQTPAATSMIIVLNIYLPLGLAVLQAILMSMYKLDKLYPQILADLHKRKIK
ncbi:glycoside/pentoside/hexuronide:cation symporter, GPH family [Mesobacillus persicus]|uniref:Glycoside/pentoside/hexuronide:cation symporter, GPH family n=1 Tax=Mesobacillus persicus TaxID=930146 RepID=A0A1H7VR15_9BACI|nr:glycoside-pentoside-hexuronide (GPH):cation symporter [Mesobacillus persicus]SEM11237.1 glycoside/pentoside/hexuronide:cation symporter, GPH family [Mesobacillus persicus]